MNTLDELIERLWQRYAADNVQAGKIHEALQAKGEIVVNDHIAFRTFGRPRVGVDVIAHSFLEFGYEEKDTYTFVEKKLFAKHYEHPDEQYPRVFISELKVDAFSKSLQATVDVLIDAIPEVALNSKSLPASQVLWPMIRFETYEALRAESEYAAWLAAFGYCANHFTVNVNALKGFDTLTEFNEFVKSLGYAMNESGGSIKGSADVYLEQSSTLASPVTVNFADGPQEIPCCYYEFAKRYPLPNGTLFSGFVAKSADKIFESTDKGDL